MTPIEAKPAKEQTPVAEKSVAPAAEKPAVKPPPPPVVTPPKREQISLKYQGLLRRDDGTLTALIEDSHTRHAAFYATGTNVLGYRLDRIKPEQLDIVRGAEPVTVRRGVATAIEETPHAD